MQFHFLYRSPSKLTDDTFDQSAGNPESCLDEVKWLTTTDS